MIEAALAIGGLGLVAAAALGVAAKVFYVEVDPLVVAIEGALPGANCGGCGQPGCAGAAAAIAMGNMPANGCVAGGAEVAKEIARIMGVEIKETEPEIAQVGCRYPMAKADRKFTYTGINDCRAAAALAGGPKECPVGCIGLGSCIKACPFDAMVMGPDNLPVVIAEKCTGCGTCVRTCPMGIMQLTNVTNRILNEFTWDECTAPCQRRCPAGINIPEQIHQTALGNYQEALKVIKERNPLPLICGRICPQPCELICRRNLEDEPVAINNLKRFVADRERTSGKRAMPFKAPPSGYKTAVIGGGVQGLSAAYFLARLGHGVKIFEAKDKMGGLLRTAIPKNRLPREVLDWEIDGILEMGVDAETGAAFGKDVTISGLFDQGYDAVQIAVGGWDTLLQPGNLESSAPALPQIHLMLPLSLAWATGKDITVGEKTVIVGGGRNAVNVARRALKHGAKSVDIILSESLYDLGMSEDDTAALADEGITVRESLKVTELYGIGDRLTGLTCKLGPTREKSMPADTIITAGGRLPDMIIMKTPQEAEESDTEGETAEVVEAAPVPGSETKWHTVMPYATRPRRSGMFETTEAPSDHWAAVEAIGAGRRAAASIHQLLNGQLPHGPERDIGREPAEIDVDGELSNLAETGPRVVMPEAGPMERLNPDNEVALGLSETEARKEADRCLNCGLICYDRNYYPPIIPIEQLLSGVK